MSKLFYLKYLNYQPVEIDTHVTNERTALRLFPLNTVSQLISAYQARPGSFLSNTDSGLITIHLPDGLNRSDLPEECFSNETSTSLDPGCLLSTLYSLQINSKHPLIIKSLNDTVTMDEYMISILPHPEYINPVLTSNVSGSYVKKPDHYLLWTDFAEKTLNWITANHQQHSERINRPVFFTRVITEEVQTLQPFILDNLLSISAKCFIPHSEFNPVRQIKDCKGSPDHLMTRNGNIVAIVEEKGRWNVPTSDILNSQLSSCISAIHQLYYYMRLNHRKYGILTSYEHTWFFYRSQKCEYCDKLTVHDTLYISEGFSYTANKPTVLQCLSYFNSIVDSVDMDSPPTSKPSSRDNSATQISQINSPIESPRASVFRSNSSLSTEIQSNQQQQEFDVDDFKLDKVIGEGRSKVYSDYYECNPIALKVADIAKNREMLPELLNEVSVYEQLSELQGNGIPKLLCHGYLECILYCIGVSLCGEVGENFTHKQKEKLLDILESIHNAGILHNDLRKENILIDKSGNPYIIDFGFSTRNCSSDAQMEERNILLDLIGNI